MRKITSILTLFIACVLHVNAQSKMEVVFKDGYAKTYDVANVQDITWDLNQADITNCAMQVDLASSKDKPWDSQIFIALPRPLQTSTKYKVSLSVKGNYPIDDLGAFIENDASSSRDEWGNSADVQHLPIFPVTTEWKKVSLGYTDGRFMYDRFVLQLGNYKGTLYFDDIEFVDETTGCVITVNFNHGLNKIVTTRSFHPHVSYSALVRTDEPEVDEWPGICPNGNHPHIIDLGYGVKWACCNVGATCPEEYGDYYAWGETSSKGSYDWDNYVHCANGKYTSQTKYNSVEGWGVLDNKDELELIDDVARAKWGGHWRMPTLQELQGIGTWEYTEYNGVGGYMFTGRNGRKIFLRAAGCINGKTNGSIFGYYWTSSTPGMAEAYYMYMYGRGIECNYETSTYRYVGMSVRPVWDESK